MTKTPHAHTKESVFAQRPDWCQMACPSEKEGCQDKPRDDIRVNSPRKPNISRCYISDNKDSKYIEQN